MENLSVVLKELVEERGINFNTYLEKMSEPHKEKWIKRVKELVIPLDLLNKYDLSDNHKKVKIIVFSAEWCPDSRFATPIAYLLSKQYPNIDFYIIDREDGWEALEFFKINGDKKVPTIVFLNENYEETGRWVENSALSYYLRYKVKKEMTGKTKEEYREKLRETLSNNREELLRDATEEMLSLLVKAVILSNQE